MTITAHDLVSAVPNGNRQNVTYRFTDHLAETYDVHKLVPQGHDTDADMLSMYAGIEASLAEAEIGEAIDLAEGGIDILSRIQNPDHTTSKIIGKRVIYHMMRTRDPFLVIALEPFIVWLRATYTAAQLKTFLDLTDTQAVKMNQRINAILDNKADFDVYEANAEDIED